MTTTFAIEAPGLSALLAQAATIPTGVRRAMESALAEELISLEEDLRGPTEGSPGDGLYPGRWDPRGPPQSPLAPGSGLVPINTGRLLQSFDAIPRGLSATMTANAQDPRSGFFYAEVAHFEGGDPGEAVALATARWETMAERASSEMEKILTDHLAGP